jgi:hypothetical protein
MTSAFISYKNLLEIVCISLLYFFGQDGTGVGTQGLAFAGKYSTTLSKPPILYASVVFLKGPYTFACFSFRL